MELKENIALFDMDGTLCDHDSALARDYNKIKSPEEPPHKPFSDDVPEHVKDRRRLIRSQYGWWENLERLELGFNILDMAERLGFKIHILTKGPGSSPNAWTEKMRWIKKHVGDVEMTITDNKGLVYGKVLVDDYPPYIESWLKWRPRGLVIMPAHNWNENFHHPNVIRCDGSNLDEVEKALKEAKER
jgi:FMN phosphatase YigB (HAD superfamily)